MIDAIIGIAHALFHLLENLLIALATWSRPQPLEEPIAAELFN